VRTALAVAALGLAVVKLLPEHGPTPLEIVTGLALIASASNGHSPPAGCQCYYSRPCR